MEKKERTINVAAMSDYGITVHIGSVKNKQIQVL